MRLSKRSNRALFRPARTIPANWLTLGSVLFLLVLWYFITEYTGLINPLFIPSPLKVVAALIKLLTKGLSYDIIATVGRVMIAFIISIIVALPLALFMSESIFLKRLLTPYIDFIRYIPVPVLIPLTILFFGIGEEAKIVLLFVGTFFQMVLLFDGNLLAVPKDYFDLAHSLNFTSCQRLQMKLQVALPDMYDNARISLGLCWSYVIIAELVASETGLGHLIKEAQRFSLTSDVYVGILVMGTIGFCSDYLFKQGYKVFFPYKN